MNQDPAEEYSMNKGVFYSIHGGGEGKREGRGKERREGRGREGRGREGRGEERTGEDRTGQDRTGQDRTGQEKGGKERRGEEGVKTENSNYIDLMMVGRLVLLCSLRLRGHE